jgi:hypothetical protein
MYIPLAGLAIYFAAALVEGRDWLWQRARRGMPAPSDPFDAARVLTVTLVALVLPLARNRDPLTMLAVLDPAIRYIAETRKDIVDLNEPLPTGARVLLLKCRYPDDDWGPLMVMRLLYHDRTLWVDRPAMMATQPDDAARSSYDRVIDFDGKKWVIVVRNYRKSAASNNRPT